MVHKKRENKRPEAARRMLRLTDAHSQSTNKYLKETSGHLEAVGKPGSGKSRSERSKDYRSSIKKSEEKYKETAKRLHGKVPKSKKKSMAVGALRRAAHS
jgi:hypothetical protein